MAFDNIRLEKGMYRESGKSFTQVLEALDPARTTRARLWTAPTRFSASSNALTSR